MVELLWLIPALPLAGFAVLLLFGKRVGEPLAGWLGTAVVALSFVTFSRMLGDVDGQTVVVFVLVVAAAEVVVGLGIIVALLRKQPAATADDINVLKG